MTRFALLLAAAGLLAISSSSCTRDDGMTLRSKAFEDGGGIPLRYSCEGDNQSPPLSWSKVPDEAVELALVVADPDADGVVFHHWVVLGIDPADGEVAAGAVPEGAVQAEGSSENPTWIGPCPPDGEKHEYVFSLYPLARPTGLAEGVELKTALDAIDDSRIDGGQAELTGTFER